MFSDVTPRIHKYVDVKREARRAYNERVSIEQEENRLRNAERRERATRDWYVRERARIKRQNACQSEGMKSSMASNLFK